MTNTRKTSEVAGIDLGTTNTVAACLDDTGRPQTVPNKDGEHKTSSAVYLKAGGGEILVGESARNMKMLEPEHTFLEVKRDLDDNPVYLQEGDLEVTPSWCQTQLLRYVRESAMDHFDDPRAISKAVITVPAYFNEQNRQCVMESARLAGIEVLKLINEPTAAAIAYGLREKQGDRLVLVADFGGGTFDASLAQINSGEIEIIASNGDRKLGGSDVDDLLVELALAEFRKEGLEISTQTHPADYFLIREDSVRNKHMLASRQQVNIVARVEGKSVQVEIDRAKLGELCLPLMDRVQSIIEEMLSSAKVDRKDVQCVLPIGGSSRLLPFRKLLENLFGKDAIIGGSVSPDIAVAEGAAIHAAQLITQGGEKLVDDEMLHPIPVPVIKTRDVMSHSLGVAVQDRVSDAPFCKVILERNTPIPCERINSFASMDKQQTQFSIQVIQGEDGQSVDECLIVGERILTLPTRNPAEKSIEVSMSYDESGLVTVRVHDLISGNKENITVDFTTQLRENERIIS